MKKVIIIGNKKDLALDHFIDFKTNKAHYQVYDKSDDMSVSDGYHTVDELYDHRITLFIALCRNIQTLDGGNKEPWPQTNGMIVWRSHFHADGSIFEGEFIMGIKKAAGEQITYHIPLSRWEETEFAETLEKAPEWDRHTSNDVLNRLKTL